MDHLQDFLQAVGYHAVILWPLLPVYIHLIISALFPIFTGAHASLSRPSSAARPPKKTKKSTEDAESDESDEGQKMEGLSPMDAVLFPVMGGMTLVGLYCLIKYLEDPALLNKIMNWYFALFGTLSLARFLTDTMGNIWSFLFPNVYQHGSEFWKIDVKARKAWATKKTQLGRTSPLPQYLALLSLPTSVIDSLWTTRGIPSRKLQIHAYVHNSLKANFKVGPFGLISFVLAVAVELYFNLVAKPWWLTNLLGFSLSYAALQIMSPTTAWTGTLILSGLFFYDIYFVFFTPVMVTVARTIDVPAKLLFPRPETDAMSMLGLGDVVLPGMIIGFALRFDLFIFYLRKQKHRKGSDNQHRATRSSTEAAGPAKHGETEVVKAKWIPAAGGWGERFWMSRASQNAAVEQGGKFPKTYFYTTITGYITGLLFTLGVMQVFGHAQPALLYLVPGVLGALWGTAIVKGEVKTLWNFSEAEEEAEEEGTRTVEKEGAETTKKSNWMDLFVFGRVSKKMEEKEKQTREAAKKEHGSEADAANGKVEETKEKAEKGKEIKGAENSKTKTQKWDGKLVSFSISLPQPSTGD